MIVLLSLTSTERMSPLTNLMKQRFKSIHFSHYEGTSNPGTLFNGVKAQLAIFIANNSVKNNNYLTTKYLRFYSTERDELFKSTLKYIKYDKEYFNLVPKVSNSMGLSILNKIINYENTQEIRTFEGGEFNLYYRNMGNFFWKLAFKNEPYYSLNGFVNRQQKVY